MAQGQEYPRGLGLMRLLTIDDAAAPDEFFLLPRLDPVVEPLAPECSSVLSPLSALAGHPSLQYCPKLM